jgi:CheY-like chemotaxis protein
MDKTRVRQVLINLLNNAARFTDQGGVTISAQRREDEIVVCVADTGIGISEKDLAKVFEEFRQLDGSIRRRAGGSGLGLAISRQLIDLHGGRMWVESKEGEGASFYFSLPLHDELSAQRQHRDWELAAHVGAPLAKKDSVIVVAQEARAASLFERYLDGYRIIPASSVAGALHMLEQEQARAVINTVTSGDLGWLDPKSVQASPLSLPVVAVSLRGHKLTVQDMAVTSYLTKPVLQEHLTTVLHGLGDHVRDVLVVDDDHDTVRLLARMVRLAGSHYRVSRAYDGEQALAAMTKRRPDAVILDLLMPGIDGYEVLDRMRRTPRLKDVHVIVATARGREQESITADAFGITRPDGFAVGEVMRCLKAALDAL